MSFLAPNYTYHSYVEWETLNYFRGEASHIGWHEARTIKDYLVRAKNNNKDTKESKRAQCNGKCSQVCQYNEETCEFEDADGNKYNIIKGSYKLQHKFYCL